MVKWIIVAILLLPVAEIATFVAVGHLIGFGWAIVLALATSAAGFLVLRHAGRSQLTRFRSTVTQSDGAAFEAHAAGFFTVLAGILLFLPGFLTDLTGALLLLGPVRRAGAAAVRRTVMGRDQGPAVVDLAPEEWQAMPDRDATRDPRLPRD